MIPNLLQFSTDYFSQNNSKYNFVHQSDCGIYTEQFLIALRLEDPDYVRFTHLRKYGSQTQYNGHAIDVVLFDNRGLEGGTDFMEADIIGAAESDNANATWQGRDTQYTEKDMMQPEDVGTAPPSGNTVPWMAYDENSFQLLKQYLEFDYGRRPQAADFDVSVWSARVFHSAYMGPSGIPLGMDAAIEKHRIEWCASLGVTVVPLP